MMFGMAVAGTLKRLYLDLPGHYSGKVRETWSLPGGRRLLVTTDRLSALDRVIGLVPNKGQVLTQVSAWWFERTADIVANHLIEVPDPNVMIAVDARPLPVEVVVRGRMTGSTSTAILPRYLSGERTMYGYDFPDGIEPHRALPTPIITPTTKATDGEHDEPITVAGVVAEGLVDADLWERVQRVALALFDRGVQRAAAAGFVLADTKYEFGLGPDDELLLIDEVHTPDSSRFWEARTLSDRLARGLEPESFDKEPIRLALRELGYTGEGPPPDLDDSVWLETSSRYVAFYERLTGQTFVPAAQPAAERIASAMN